MAFPSKTTDEEIIGTAIDLVAQHGADHFTMAALAKALEVKPPSLYKRFAGRDAILAHVEHYVFKQFSLALKQVSELQPRTAMRAFCYAHRTFAAKNPHLYPILFLPSLLDPQTARNIRYQSAEPALAIFADDPPSLALKKLRTVTAYVHGFVSIELASGFQMGGEVDDAFAFGVDTLCASITGSAPEA